jgi:MFS family permease
VFLGSILISWGLVATLFAWMKTSAQFYILRFILGLAESGAYPGESMHTWHSTREWEALLDAAPW